MECVYHKKRCSKATQVTVDPSNLTAEAVAEFNKAQGELSTALGRLLLIQENYPELKANENFRDLQAQLEGTEIYNFFKFIYCSINNLFAFN